MRVLFIGGARSGKSSLAQRLSGQRSADVCVLVTGTESDPEMAARIAAHRRERPSHWRVREETVRLGRALRDEKPRLVLVDCLTLWISNCLWATGPEADLARWRYERDDFVAALREATNDVIIVTNEVGTGIVPGNAASRIFRDEQGWLNQAVAAVCDEVYLVTAGLPMCLKRGPVRTTTPAR
ncbi:MAG: bifunctional adenosylcobinamide kinase/adenosylcobinamide-phosphate guanylyltransferase [Proteobacteria bacterium]|nr:bifunctional adenosylcobinamide kinase/adenosylcobinamide-phosphate guanylyltransferase [Pseudomonadota bacterium]